MKEEKEKTTKTTPTKKSGTKSSTTTKKTTSTNTKAKKSTPTNTKASTKTKKTGSTKTNEVKKTTSKTESPTTKKTSTTKKTTSTSKKAPATKKTTKGKETKGKEVEEIKNDKFIITEEIVDEIETPKEEFPKIEKEEKKDAETIAIQPKREIPKTNYIVVAIIVVWVIIISFIGYNLYGKHQKQLYEEGFFNRGTIDIQKTTLSEIRSKIDQEQLANIFVLFSYHGTEEQYKLEKDIADLVKEYRLQKNFYYIDLTNEELTESCDAVCSINKELGTNIVTNTPSVVYLRNKKVLDVAQREDKKILDAADFAKILDIYEFEK